MSGTEYTATDPEDLIEITGGDGRFSSGYYEWNGQRLECRDHNHLTRADALTCAEDRLRYRS